MSIGDAMGGREKAKSHIRNLVRIAGADGVIDDAERKLLLRIARRYELSEEDVDDIIVNIDKMHFTPPATKQERYTQLYNLGRMVMADGVQNEAEVTKISAFAVGLGFPTALVPKLVEEVIALVVEKLYEDDAVERIDAFMKANS
ncbi:MAG: TerB family tellurite resistance protein [Flavobacteriales bacterium]|nr:TerB family tellurite resistance protein [Flavobacteriales bacterium]